MSTPDIRQAIENDNLCNFYQEAKDLKDGDSKIFTCNCRRHKGNEISVVKYDGTVREVSLPPKVDLNDYIPETFDHMLTVLMIMFGDARDAGNDNGDDSYIKQERLEKEAFEYARSWLEEHDGQLIAEETAKAQTARDAALLAKIEGLRITAKNFRTNEVYVTNDYFNDGVDAVVRLLTGKGE